MGRPFTFTLALLLALIQYPLWFGKGGWLRVWDLEKQLAQQRLVNSGLESRNQALDSEVQDLRQGLAAIEERARYELGMVRPNEFFVQFDALHRAVPAAPPPAMVGDEDVRRLASR
jgi:cell division protein FtsB